MNNIFIYVLLAGIVAFIATRKSRDGTKWFLVSLLITPALAGIALLLIGKSNPKPKSSPTEKRPQIKKKRKDKPEKLTFSCTKRTAENKLSKNFEWLINRWADAFDDKAENQNCSFVPDWFFDVPTDRQKRKLEELGVNIDRGNLSKGQYSDLIGLFYPLDEEDAPILKFFKIPLTGMNETKGRHELRILFSNPDNLAKWENRPATQTQKEFYKHFGFVIPKGLSQRSADEFIEKQKSELYLEQTEDDELEPEDNASLLKEWEALEQIFSEFNDPEYREDYNLKKISHSMLMKAINSLKLEGYSLSKLADDTDEIVERLLEIKPELEKD